MKFFVCMLGLSLSTLGVAKATFTEKSLDQLIRKNKVTTIDQLVKVLPSDLLKNPMLVYDSHALDVERVSMESPRVILFNEDASLILAFTKNPGADVISRGKDKLELISFTAQKKFIFKAVPFDGKKTPSLASAEKNPRVCLACHGTEPRPIFNDYNAWPGFYGSFGTRGYAAKGTLEHAGLENFLQKKPNLSRYDQLDLGGYVADEIGIRTTARDMGELADKVKFTINLMFGSKLEGLMWKRLGAKLVSDKKFSTLAPLFYALGEESNRCGPIRDRVRALGASLKARESWAGQASEIIARIDAQTLLDNKSVSARVLDLNSVNRTLDRRIDDRGIINLPLINLLEINMPATPVDRAAFQDLLLMTETVFRKLNYSSSDLSTTPGMPTSGIFHLSRLGQLLVDEQIFQNLFGGIAAASPKFKERFDNLSCEQVSWESEQAIQQLELPDPKQSGVLYL